MQERPAQGAPPDGIQGSSTQGPLGNSFLGGKRYPGEGLAPTEPPRTPAGPARGRTFTLIVLPVALFLAGIAAIAWIMQYLPGGGRGSSPGPDLRQPKPLITFLGQLPGQPGVLAQWEPPPKVPPKPGTKVPPYAAEYEVSTDATHPDGGHYDYEFTNPEGQSLEVGLESMNCQCSRVTICVLNDEQWSRYRDRKRQEPDPIARSRQSTTDDGLPWKELIQKDHKGVVVPPKGSGVVRLFWDGRRKKGPESDLLKLELWVTPPGKFSQRALVPLGAYVAYVEPARFYPKELDVGTLDPQVPQRSAHLYCWSATRRLKLSASQSDPCLTITIKELDEQERESLTRKLRELEIMTRVRSAFRVDVTVHEQKGDKRLDLGSFSRSLPLEVRGPGDLLPVAPPVVRGRVQGDIRVGGRDDKGHITLKPFKSNHGARATAELWAKQGLELDYDGCQPADLNFTVKLPKQPEEGGTGWAVWRVELRVPEGLQPGPLPEETAIILRTRDGQRRIRIPVRGTVMRADGL
jgi:hypothetical protein